MIIDCIADLHGFYPKLEGGDLLIVAGDLTARDTVIEHMQFQVWLHDQKYKKKVVIAGNHDNRLQVLPYEGIKRQYEEMEENYLCDSGTEFQGLKIWGSPWTKTFEGMNPHCMAFTCDTEEELYDKFVHIPKDTDILVTHGPPNGTYDQNVNGDLCGSEILLKEVCRVKPLLHVFGHIHEEGGRQCKVPWIPRPTICVNASHVNERYQPVNKPIRVIL
jgi:Icc-related predicted phosphoesterase